MPTMLACTIRIPTCFGQAWRNWRGELFTEVWKMGLRRKLLQRRLLHCRHLLAYQVRLRRIKPSSSKTNWSACSRIFLWILLGSIKPILSVEYVISTQPIGAAISQRTTSTHGSTSTAETLNECGAETRLCCGENNTTLLDRSYREVRGGPLGTPTALLLSRMAQSPIPGGRPFTE